MRSVPRTPARSPATCTLALTATLVAFAPGATQAQAAADEDDACGGFTLGESTELDVQPALGATGVARDAPVVVRYRSALERAAIEDTLAAGERLVSLLRDPDEPGGARVPVPGSVARIDARTVAFVPTRRLAPGTRYYPLVAKPGFDTAAFAELRFDTSDHLDAEPPTLGFDADDIAVSSRSIPPECAGPPGGRRVGVAFDPASDDGDDGSIEYFLYLTRGLGVEGPELHDRARAFDDRVRMSLLLTAAQAQSRACVAIRVVDGVGRAADEDPEVCFDPIEGSHFEPCTAKAAIGASDTEPRVGGMLFAGLALGLLSARRRYRTGRRH